MNATLEKIREEIDGYIDGAPDAGPASRLANRIALIIEQAPTHTGGEDTAWALRAAESVVMQAQGPNAWARYSDEEKQQFAEDILSHAPKPPPTPSAAKIQCALEVSRLRGLSLDATVEEILKVVSAPPARELPQVGGPTQTQP
jgi:hypothetical protein